MSVDARRATPALLQVDAILQRLGGTAALTEVCRYLRQEFGHYRWVGVYRREGEMLELAGWEGPAPTVHERIPVGQGICGRAARLGTTVIVDDVGTAPEYLACFPETRSEIVVPVRSGAEVLGEIDIDGDRPAAYDATDDRFLTEVAHRLVPVLRALGAPGAAPGAAGAASPGAPPPGTPGPDARAAGGPPGLPPGRAPR